MSFFRLARYALFLGLGCLRAADVEVSDENLESLIRSALEKPEGALTTADMESLTALSSDGGTLLDSEKIEGLGGLQFATGLKSLHLPRHTLSDLSPLANLTELESLDLAGNRIDDCSAVAWLTSIVWLDLSDNHLTSVAPLGGFDDSVFIDVSRNFLDLDDFLTAWVIDGLKSAGVEVLFSEQDTTSLSIGVDKDHFDDGGGVGMATVESNTYWTASSDSDWLVLSPGAENGFGNDTFSFSVSVLPEGVTHRLGYISAGEDVVEISQGTGIVVELSDAVLEWHVRETLGRHEGSITVSHMEQLTQLALSGLDLFPDLPFENLSGLEYATNLLTLSIVDSEVSNLDPIRGLSSLKSLYVYDADLGDAGDLSGLSSLDSLTLYSCSLTEIPQLPESLERLFLSGNSIVDLTPLAGRPQLVAVEINDNQIADLGPLSGLVNLRSLRLDNNAIRGIAPLAGLASLEDLLIYSNHIRSIEAIASLPKLTEVGLHYNYIDFSEGGTEAGYLQEMRDRGVQFPNTTQFSAVPLVALEGGPWGPSGGAGEISVVSGTYWSASTDADWISLIDAADRLGSDAFAFEVASAPDLAQNRSGTIWVEDVGVTITQYPALSIPDPVLEAAIRDALELPDRNLLAPDLAMLEQLVVEGLSEAGESEKLADLSGLEHAVNLEHLTLSGTLVSSLEPLRDLTKLRVLFTNGSLIEEATQISGLASLELLTLANGGLQQIPSMPASVISLDLSGNAISDLSPLADESQLVRLELADNRIADLAPLAGLSNLRSLSLKSNLVQDASDLKDLLKLEELLINGNHLRSAEEFLSLTALKYLDARFNYIDVAPGGEGATTLQQLAGQGVEAYLEAQMNPIPNLANGLAAVGHSSLNLSVDFETSTFWSASADVPWVELSRIEGFESAMLNLRIGANHTNAERIATVTISGASFTVTQGYDEEYFGYIAAKGRETGQQINWPNEDADGDGVSNREEFELGANPFDGAWAPVFGIRECEDAANVLVVGRVEDGVSRVIEFSEDLVGWIELKVESEEMEAGTLLFRDELTAGERGSPRFYRQRIDR